jgi:hypothetical protein
MDMKGLGSYSRGFAMECQPQRPAFFATGSEQFIAVQTALSGDLEPLSQFGKYADKILAD